LRIGSTRGEWTFQKKIQPTTIFRVCERKKEKFVEKVKEIERFGSVKIDFGMLVRFSTERDGETQNMKHYFGGGKEKPTFISKSTMKTRLERNSRNSLMQQKKK